MITDFPTVITYFCILMADVCIACYNRLLYCDNIFLYYCLGLTALESANHSQQTFPCIYNILVGVVITCLNLNFTQL